LDNTFDYGATNKRKNWTNWNTIKNWDIQINYGLKTRFNDAFIIDDAKRKELIAEDSKSAEIIRPILRGRDIKRYGYDFAEKYVICARVIANIPDNYPAICKYLEQFKGTGKLGDNSTTKVFKRPWWSWMQEPVNYWDDFSKQKIVWGEISDKTKFCIDLDGKFTTEATTFLMTGQSLLYLLGFLNSKISEHFFSKIGTTTGVGTVRWKKYTIEQLRVPAIPSKRHKEYDGVVKEIVERHLKKENIEKLVSILDNMIYQDLQLTEEEVKFIESL
jgi:adenine-specific DNA-methyltransferase